MPSKNAFERRTVISRRCVVSIRAIYSDFLQSKWWKQSVIILAAVNLALVMLIPVPTHAVSPPAHDFPNGTYRLCLKHGGHYGLWFSHEINRVGIVVQEPCSEARHITWHQIGHTDDGFDLPIGYLKTAGGNFVAAIEPACNMAGGAVTVARPGAEGFGRVWIMIRIHLNSKHGPDTYFANRACIAHTKNSHIVITTSYPCDLAARRNVNMSHLGVTCPGKTGVGRGNYADWNLFKVNHH